jgi:hypothetical protein
MENEQQFKSNWRSAANKVDETTVQNLMEGVKRKARLFGFGNPEEDTVEIKVENRKLKDCINKITLINQY